MVVSYMLSVFDILKNAQLTSVYEPRDTLRPRPTPVAAVMPTGEWL